MFVAKEAVTYAFPFFEVCCSGSLPIRPTRMTRLMLLAEAEVEKPRRAAIERMFAIIFKDKW